MTTTARLPDVMCMAHMSARVWPAGRNIHDLLAQCTRCRQRVNRSFGPSGAHIVGLPDLTDRQFDHEVATHEAAHAVVGLAAGARIRFATVEGRRADVGPAGGVNWEPSDLYAKDIIALTLAGQVASLRWLKVFGFNTLSNRLDVLHMAGDDTMQAAEYRAAADLPQRFGMSYAEELVDRHWDVIARLADRLAATRFMSGDEVRELTGF